MKNFGEVFFEKKVLVTGHTGFTGSWACSWLQKLGAKVAGFSLEPNTSPSLYKILHEKSDGLIESKIGNIKNFRLFSDFTNYFKPDLVLHLAAQPLVIEGYKQPFETFNTNTMGTLNVLEACRLCESVKAVLCITTDKVYKNKEWYWPYREQDEIGGTDPYSASKSSAEHIINSYMSSFSNRNLQVACARGGNIIGGGDWAENRIIPDFVRSISGGNTLSIRNPGAVRPWQHVLCLIHGYLKLSSLLLTEDNKWQGAWNFGPSVSETYTVKDVVDVISEKWQKPNIEIGEESEFKECMVLKVDSSKAQQKMSWTPGFNTLESLQVTAEWYKEYYSHPSGIVDITNNQIDYYLSKISGSI